MRARRALGARVLVAGVTVVLLGAFFRVQVLGAARWSLRADANHLRRVVVPAPRGVIYDRHGHIMADNVPGYAITLLPGPADSIRATLERMAPLLDLSAERIDRMDALMRRYGREILIDANAGFGAVSALMERAANFPGVAVEMRPTRHYPAGAAAAHLVGYVGSIEEGELGSEAFPEARYSPGSSVGKVGLERRYEATLRGHEGMKLVEVDARGRIVGDFVGRYAMQATPGTDLHLEVDLELQQWIHDNFPRGKAGAVVALDPENGGVLALYSAPSYESGILTSGTNPAAWHRLESDPERPLLNRAIQGLYAPASTWKTAAAAIALDLRVVRPEETMPIPCTGSFPWGGRLWRCWKPEGHGANNLAEALGNSCDVYFYQLGLRIGLDRLLREARRLGFADPTGIDLPFERAGTFPADRSYWKERFGYAAGEGEVLSLAIGQGPNAQTPVRMAQFYEALARGGEAPPPRLAQGVDLGPGWRLDLDPADVDALLHGLRRVTAPGGTAHLDATLELWDVLGKTGTGQNAASLSGRGENDAWFAGMAGPPGQPPEIVIVVLVEQGGGGSAVAAPIATKAADFYLRRKHGIALDSVQTLREWIAVRGWPDWHNRRFGEHP